MKRWVLAIGLLLIFVGLILALRSYLPEQKSTTEWQIVKTTTSSAEISANFTAGDKVELIVTPMEDWTNMMEPHDDLPYDAKFVWINITDPQGGVCKYEITFAKPQTGSIPSFYQATKLFIGGGFDGGTSNDTLNAAQAIVGNPTISGTYVAKFAGILPGGGSYGPLTLEKQVTTIDTSYPYGGYITYAAIIIIVGVAFLLWGIKPRKRRVSRRT